MTPPDVNPVLATVTRGSLVESFHRGVAVVVRDGRTMFAAGDAAAPQFLRSSAKPFQALAAITRILDAGFALSDREIAVIAASHGGQPIHVETVAALLERGGLSVADLQCGAHAPTHGPSAATLVRAGASPTPLHHNCSGKHAGMLLAARLSGDDTASYLDPDHPVQLRNRGTLATFAQVPPDDVGVEIDGCSAPTFVLPARAAAIAFGNLVTPGSVMPDSTAWRRLREAIPAEPIAYCGEGRTCTKLVIAGAGTIFPKIGAEGFYALGVAGRRVGIAIKFDDGSHRATEPLIATLLLRFVAGLPAEGRAALEAMLDLPVKNARGRVVGRVEITLP